MNSRVKVSMGFTMNIGNFESLRIDVGVEDDVRENETVKDASERVYKFVENTLTTKVTEARKDLA